VFDTDLVEIATGRPKEYGLFPDIYYVILDGYARADILDELYGYDNSRFLDYLERHGFFVAETSHSNYC
jgi:hypothetical protein